jgi:membrane-associated phospholipid phosphatase
MRFYEWLTIVYFLFFTALAWVRALSMRRRLLITAAAAIGVTAIVVLRPTSLRDWLPLAFIPLAYFQTGQFVLPLNRKFQSKLEAFDRGLVFGLPPRLMFVFELAYLFCYPLVPAGLVALYLSGQDRFAAEFWNVVLPPAYLCYATFPFVQTLPPRAIEDQVPWQPERTRMRTVNLFVLRHVSTQANTFPSGHVAASVAVALVLMAHSLWVGLVFMAVAVCIAAGAFFGRYHYGIDVIIGAVLAVISWVIIGRS